MAMEDEINDLKKMLRSLVVSSPTQVDVRSLLRDYRTMVGSHIPLAKFGYRDPVTFLREQCSDSFVFQGQASNPVLTLIVPDTLKHIDNFVQKQRMSSTVKFKGKRRSIPESAVVPDNNMIAKTFTKNIRSRKISEENIPEATNLIPENIISRAPDISPKSEKHGEEKYTRNALQNFLKKRTPMYNLDSAGTEVNDVESSICDQDSGRLTASSTSSSMKRSQLEELKMDIKAIVSEHPEGVWCTDLLRLYREAFGRELNYSRFGYTSVLSVACLVRGLHVAPAPDGDWRVYGSSISGVYPTCPPAGRVGRVGGAGGAGGAGGGENARPPPLDPDDALPGIDYEPDVFPEDCLHFMESIPNAAASGLRPGHMLEVMVGEVYSPSHFWLVRLGPDHHIAMEEVMDQMTRYYTTGEGAQRQLALGAVRVGHYCSSCYEGDWHRSLIVRILDSDTVKVRHVDYGTVETCSVSGLKPLRREWGALPAQALRARLAAARPPAAGRRWPRAAAAAFLARVRDARLVANVVARDPAEDILEVLLIDTSSSEDVCIGTELVRTGHADPRPDSTVGTSECYLYPRFDALESGATPNYAEIHAFLRDGIALEFVDDYRRHVPPCLPDPPHAPTPDPPPVSASASTDAEPDLADTSVAASASDSEAEPRASPPPSSARLARSLSSPGAPRPPDAAWPARQDRTRSLHPLDRPPSRSPPRPSLTRVPLRPAPSSPPRAAPPPRPPPKAAPSPFRPMPAFAPFPPPPPVPFYAPMFHAGFAPPPPPPMLPFPPHPHSYRFPCGGGGGGGFDGYGGWAGPERSPPPPYPGAQVSLSANDCEIFKLLSSVEPAAAHRFMLDALNRATVGPAPAPAPAPSPAPRPASTLNPEAAEFRMVSACTQTEAASEAPLVSLSPSPAGGVGGVGGAGQPQVSAAVRLFLESAAWRQSAQHVRPPPGFEND